VDEVEQALADARLAARGFELGLRIAAIAVRPNALGDRFAEAIDSAGQVRPESQHQLGGRFGVRNGAVVRRHLDAQEAGQVGQPLGLTAAISGRSASFGSVPVVSTSTTTSSLPASIALTNSRTESVPGSMNGSRFGLPTAFWSSSWRSMSGRMARWANRIAS